MAYGRNVTAQKGAGINYDRGAASDARSYLQPEEVGSYEKNLGIMGRDRWGYGSGKNTWDGSRQHVSKLLKTDRLQRYKAEAAGSKLRDTAAQRALGEFRRAGMQTSKPWLRTASEGLITSETVNSPIDVDKLYWTRKKGPGAKDRMTRNQKARVGDIAKYKDFKYEAIGIPGQSVRSNNPAPLTPPTGSTTTPTPPPVDTGNTQTSTPPPYEHQPWMDGLTDQAIQDILNQDVPLGSTPPPSSTTPPPSSPPVDTGGDSGGGLPSDETGETVQELIDRLHRENLAKLGGG